jgi:uncharacterized membrane protein YcfT
VASHALPGRTTSGSARPGRAPTPGRSAWADAAKGLCILLVVSWHVIWKHYLYVQWALPVPIAEAWSVFGRMLLPMRMPLFFLISGMFAAAAVHRPWRLVARTRVAKFLYLYAVWLLVHTAVLAPIPVPFDTEIARDARQLLEQLAVTPTALWYLLALALYFVVAKLLRRAPAAPVLVVAFALSAVSAANLLDSPGNRGALYQNLVFFLAGLYLRKRVEALAARATWPLVLATGAAFGAALAAMMALDAKEVVGVWPAAGVVATVFAITVMVKLSEVRWIGGPMGALGRQTLPIYVIHMPLLVLAHWALLGPLGAAPAPVRLGLAVLEPAVLTAAIVAACLGLHALLLRLRAGWLFDLPGSPAPKTADISDFVDTVVLIPRVTAVPKYMEDPVTAPMPRVPGAAAAVTMPMPRVPAAPVAAGRLR